MDPCELASRSRFRFRLRSCLWLLPIAGLAGLAGCGKAVSETGRQQMPDPLVVYDNPIVQTVTDHEEFPGRTDAVHTVEVRARVSGYLDKFLFVDGEMVKEGQPLFQIDDRPFQRTLDRAKSALAQAEAREKRLLNELRRAQVLYERSTAISREEFDRYAFDHAEAQAALATAQANLKLAALDVEFTTVKVPKFDPNDPTVHVGKVGRRLVDPGNLIKADETLMATIVTLDPIHVYFDVHEQAMLRISRLIQQGKVDPTKIPVEFALSDERDFPHRGEVNFLDNRVDVNTGTLRFRAVVRNPGNLIPPGLFVRVRLPIGDPHPAIMVREQAIQSDQGQKKVYVLRPKDEEGKPYFLMRKAPDGKWTQVMDAKNRPIPAFKPVSVEIGSLGVLRNGLREIIPPDVTSRPGGSPAAAGLKPDDLVVVVGMQKIRISKDPKDLSNLVKARPFDPEVDRDAGSAAVVSSSPKALTGDAPATGPGSHARAGHVGSSSSPAAGQSESRPSDPRPNSGPRSGSSPRGR